MKLLSGKHRLWRAHGHPEVASRRFRHEANATRKRYWVPFRCQIPNSSGIISPTISMPQPIWHSWRMCCCPASIEKADGYFSYRTTLHIIRNLKCMTGSKNTVAILRCFCCHPTLQNSTPPKESGITHDMRQLTTVSSIRQRNSAMLCLRHSMKSKSTRPKSPD